MHGVYLADAKFLAAAREFRAWVWDAKVHLCPTSLAIYGFVVLDSAEKNRCCDCDVELKMCPFLKTLYKYS